jgi:tripartite-type tricarboxylate transporter receptor subunit TctC
MLRLLAVVLLSLASLTARADFPDRPLTILVGNGAGSGLDIAARAIGARLHDRYKVPVLVMNKPGAGGTLVMREGAAAAADGYTLTLGSTVSIALAPLTMKAVTYDANELFTPVAGLGYYRLTLTTRAESPYKTLQDVMTAAKVNPDKVTFGTSLARSTTHAYIAYVTKLAGVDVPIVGYKGSASAMPDVLTGRIDLFGDAVTTARPQVAAGKLRVLLVDAEERLPYWPEVPTTREVFPGATVSGGPWLALLAPKGTPESVVAKLNRDINEELIALKDRWASLDISDAGGDLEKIRKTMAGQAALWGKFAQELGWKPE